MINVSVLGSTGSIGTQTLDVLTEHQKVLTASGLAAGSNLDLLIKQISLFSPSTISVRDEKIALTLKKIIGKEAHIFWGGKGNIRVATLTNVDRVVVATPGFPGIQPTLEAIKAGKQVALATKEVLVAAGEVITNEAEKKGLRILPIDSEHSAIFQCLEGRSIAEVNKIFLTCSGGPFRGLKPHQLKNIKKEQALSHPSWKMGRKITIDSATLMNKGFEVIEASWLFNIPVSKIKVIIHPQSVIHSAVEFIDGTIIAQIGWTYRHETAHPICSVLSRKETTQSFQTFLLFSFPQS